MDPRRLRGVVLSDHLAPSDSKTPLVPLLQKLNQTNLNQ